MGIFSILLASTSPQLPDMLQLQNSLVQTCGVPYLWLLTMNLPQAWRRSIQNYMPFGRIGAICLFHHLARHASKMQRKHVFWRISVAGARAAPILGACIGMALAQKRSRLLQWWLTFWLAAPDTIEHE